MTTSIQTDSSNEPIAVYFEYRAVGESTWQQTEQQTASMGLEFSALIEGLLPNTEYEYRAVAEYEGMLIYGETLTFRSEPIAVYFEYRAVGESTWQQTEQQAANMGLEFSALIEGLSPNTEYEYRAVAEYEGMPIYGETLTFRTVMEVYEGASEVLVAIVPVSAGRKLARGSAVVTKVRIYAQGASEGSFSGGAEVRAPVATTGAGCKHSRGQVQTTIDMATVGLGTKHSRGQVQTTIDMATVGLGTKRSRGQVQTTIDIATVGLGTKRSRGQVQTTIDIATVGLGTKCGTSYGEAWVEIALTCSTVPTRQGATVTVTNISPQGAGVTMRSGTNSGTIAIVLHRGGTKRVAGGAEAWVETALTYSTVPIGRGAIVTVTNISSQGAGIATRSGTPSSMIAIVLHGDGTKRVAGGAEAVIQILALGHGSKTFIPLVCIVSLDERMASLSMQEPAVKLEVELLPLIGNTVRLKAEFRDFDGNLFSPNNVRLRLYDGRKQQIGEDIPLTPIAEGRYEYDYVLSEGVLARVYYEFIGELEGKPILGRARLDRRWV